MGKTETAKNLTAHMSLASAILALVLGLASGLGAVERDLSKDGRIDWEDITELAEQWLAEGCAAWQWCEGADINRSSEVDFEDFALVAEDWAEVQPFITTLLATHEPFETHVEIVGPHPADPTVTIGGRLTGGTVGDPTFGDVPEATEGDYVLGMNWYNEADRKVEYGYNFSSGFTFDLAGVDEIVFDVFVPSGGLLFPNGLIGVWDPVFGWNRSANVPTAFDEWFTIVVDVLGRNNTGLSSIGALVFEDMGQPGDVAGRVFVDNVRLRRINPDYYDLVAAGHDSRIDLRWRAVPSPNVQGYNVYRAEAPGGAFTKLNGSVHTLSVYSDFFGANGRTYYYYITSVLGGGETAASSIVSATSYAMTDEQLLTSVQEATFRYFWDFAHPVSGLAREGLLHPRNMCAIGASGFGLMNILVGVERGFVTRPEGTERILKILRFLEEKAARYHGAWSHWVDGATGETIPFSQYDDGGDVVETAYLVQGLLALRRYFDSDDAMEVEIRSRAARMWQEVEWDWYLRYPGGEVLYWHWSPNHGWAMNMPIVGYNECMIAYLLAIASPTHPIPASCYYNGWAREPWYANGNTYYGYNQWVGPPYGGPLFFTHCSYVGFDPRNKSDDYCDYFDNSRNISLIHRAYCIDNPNNFVGYSALVWGLTFSTNPWGGADHSPTNDNGTITPSASLGAMPYTPAESIATLKHLYHTYGDELWGPFGFRDAFNLTEDWFSETYLGISHGTTVPMIENYRTALCWNLFMANPEIQPMLDAIGWSTPSPP